MLLKTWLPLAVACALCSQVAATHEADAQSSYRIIVNTTNTQSELSRKNAADIFLKKTTRWRDGVGIVPVDLSADSVVRQKFSNDVLGRSVSAVRNYWQQVIFSGRGLPPVELKSEEEVLRYVNEHRGAIGYVSTKVSLQGVKELAIR